MHSEKVNNCNLLNNGVLYYILFHVIMLYLLVAFPFIAMIHFDLALISLVLKGRTLTATFTDDISEKHK